MVKISNLRFKCWQCGKRVRTAQGLKTHGTRLCHQIEAPRPPQRTARKSGVMPGEDRADQGPNKPPRRKVARKSGVMPGEDHAGRSKSGERRVTTGRASSEESSQSRAERPMGTADSSEETSSSSSSSSSDARSPSRDGRPAETAGAQDEDTGAFKCDVCDEVFASRRALGTHFRSHPVQSNIARLERVLPQEQDDSEDSKDDQVDQDLQEEIRKWQEDFFNVLSNIGDFNQQRFDEVMSRFIKWLYEANARLAIPQHPAVRMFHLRKQNKNTDNSATYKRSSNPQRTNARTRQKRRDKYLFELAQHKYYNRRKDVVNMIMEDEDRQ